MAFPTPFPFSNINNLFLTISHFSECLHTCLHFEYSLQETHPQTSSLTERIVDPGYFASKKPFQVFLWVPSAKCAGSLCLKKVFTEVIENYIGLCISASLISNIPILEIWLGIFPINSSFHGPTKDSQNCYTSGQTPIKRKKEKKTPPHLHSGLSTKPPFNFLAPSSRQFRTAKGLNKIHWGQEDHTANFYPFLPERMVWGSKLRKHLYANHLFSQHTLEGAMLF